eukprot:CAMPEP_0179238672 /NCGR_PEP_ID=MMETSP0797-20121207/15067_1 /TAXON_ID=47934 /ORGANISM="Dinophysis acuminata, Strain DAEP01" /LENGTH=102 /DNA_ID=CAMNT_0020945973 /DNA_START=76 /DNA_END=384 /DNA_ORIENTATION=+
MSIADIEGFTQSGGKKQTFVLFNSFESRAARSGPVRKASDAGATKKAQTLYAVRWMAVGNAATSTTFSYKDQDKVVKGYMNTKAPGNCSVTCHQSLAGSNGV